MFESVQKQGVLHYYEASHSSQSFNKPVHLSTIHTFQRSNTQSVNLNIAQAHKQKPYFCDVSTTTYILKENVFIHVITNIYTASTLVLKDILKILGITL